jgi:hypothetical protein
MSKIYLGYDPRTQTTIASWDDEIITIDDKNPANAHEILNRLVNVSTVVGWDTDGPVFLDR